MARRRARWKTHQGKLDPRRLVFIDETWAKTNMTRTYGRCARGRRPVAQALRGLRRTLTITACAPDGPICPPMVSSPSCRRSCPETSLPQTISAATRDSSNAVSSVPPEPGSALHAQPAVPPELPVADFIQDMSNGTTIAHFPWSGRPRLFGTVGTKEAVGLERQSWPVTPVERIMVSLRARQPCLARKQCGRGAGAK